MPRTLKALYLSADEVAELAGVSIYTVRRWIHAGRYPHACKAGRSFRIPLRDIARAMGMEPEQVEELRGIAEGLRS